MNEFFIVLISIHQKILFLDHEFDIIISGMCTMFALKFHNFLGLAISA